MRISPSAIPLQEVAFISVIGYAPMIIDFVTSHLVDVPLDHYIICVGSIHRLDSDFDLLISTTS